MEIKGNLNSLNHFTKTKEVVESYLKDLLKTMKGYKFIETLELTFEKSAINPETGKRESTYKTSFFNGKAKTITKASKIESELSISQQEILNTIDIWVSEGSGWTIDKVNSKRSSYVELPMELKYSAKGLINIKKKDDECFRWCHIRHLNPQKKDPQRIKRDDKQ